MCDFDGFRYIKVYLSCFGQDLVHMRHALRRGDGLRLNTILGLVFMLNMSFSNAQNMAYSEIHDIEATFEDSSLSLSLPLSLGEDSRGNVVALDAQQQQVVVGNGGNGSVVYQHTVGTGMPYSLVTCHDQKATITTYARKKTIETISNIPGHDPMGIDYSHTFDDFGDVIISDITASHDCKTLYILDGVHKVIYVSQPASESYPNGATAPFVAVPTMNAPTSILLSVDESTLYLSDWGTGSVYELDIATSPRVFHLLAGDGSAQALIHDTTATEGAKLSGPTQLSHYKTNAAILFTDRNPTLGTSAVRILQTSGPHKGNVETLAGGNTRGWTNGEHDQVQLNAVWDVMYLDSKDEIYVSEPTVGNVRRVHDIDLHWESCPDGQYMPSTGVCHECPANSYCPGNDQAIPCGGNLESHPGAVMSSECWCFAGTAPVNGACAPCPVGKFCESFANATQDCQSGATSLAGSDSADDCLCMPGYKRNTDDTCGVCSPGSYCVAETEIPCPTGSSSLQGSDSADDCVCEPGLKFNDLRTACVDCADTEVCSLGDTEITTAVEVEIPDEVAQNMPNEITGDDAKEIFLQLMGTDQVLEDDIEILIRRIQQQQARRRLLQVEYEVIITMTVGGSSPAEVQELAQSVTEVLSDPEQVAAIIDASSDNVTITVDDVVVDTDSISLSFETQSAPTTCDSPNSQLVESVCQCNAGYAGTPPNCIACPLGSYIADDSTGKVCVQCPEFSSTAANASSSITQCVCDDGYETDDIAADGCKKKASLGIAAIVALAVGGVVLVGVVGYGMIYYLRPRVTVETPFGPNISVGTRSEYRPVVQMEAHVVGRPVAQAAPGPSPAALQASLFTPARTGPPVSNLHPTAAGLFANTALRVHPRRY